jgi:hypothetical protein
MKTWPAISDWAQAVACDRLGTASAEQALLPISIATVIVLAQGRHHRFPQRRDLRALQITQARP